jgi:hypothetical protein
MSPSIQSCYSMLRLQVRPCPCPCTCPCFDGSRGKVSLADRQHIRQTTAKTGHGVTELFERVAREVVAHGTAREESPQQGQIKAPPPTSSIYGSLCCYV